MGFFGAQLWADGVWTEVDQTGEPFDAPDEPWLFVSIHDSDIAAVQYAPPGDGTGQAFLGFTPRDYFDDPRASDPTDPVREGLGLAAWARRACGAAVEPATVERFLAVDDPDDPNDPNEPGDAGDVDLTELDEAEVFVEVKVAHFLAALGLSIPATLVW